MPIATTGVGGTGIGGGGSVPTNSVVPVVSGSTVVGQTLTTTNGTWNNSPTSYDYQWLSNGVVVGLDQNTYVLQASDIGNMIECVVTASNTAGSGSATSNSVGPVTGMGGFDASLKFNDKRNSQNYLQFKFIW